MTRDNEVTLAVNVFKQRFYCWNCEAKGSRDDFVMRLRELAS